MDLVGQVSSFVKTTEFACLRDSSLTRRAPELRLTRKECFVESLPARRDEQAMLMYNLMKYEMQLGAMELRRRDHLRGKKWASTLSGSEGEELAMLESRYSFDGSEILKSLGFLAGITFGAPWFS